MKWNRLTTGSLACALFIVGGLLGCGQRPGDLSPSAGEAQVSPTQATNDEHDHSGWWCVEHGIPEEECSMCSSKAAAACKAKGDWCDEHHRAASQCFRCDPSRADKFARLYEAKYGTQPPKSAE